MSHPITPIPISTPIPVIQIVGYKNSGKTTTVCALVERLYARGYRVGTVKHEAHDTELDTPGKDTWQHHGAGASVTAIASPGRSAIWENGERSLPELLERMHGIDVIVVEGFKMAAYPKWVLLKEQADLALLEELSSVIGVSAWFPFEHSSLPVTPLGDYDAMLTNIITAIGLQPPT